MTAAHDLYRELLAGQALSALEPEDEQVLREHLKACAPCSRELIEVRVAASHLAYATEPIDPPSSLFEGLRAHIVAGNPDAFTLSPVQEAVRAGARQLEQTSDTVVPFRRRLRLQTRAAKLVAAAASVAVAAVVSLTAWNVALQRDDVDPSLSPQAIAVLQAPGAHSQLNGFGGAVTATAVVTDDRVDIVSYQLEGKGAAERYVLWGTTDAGAPRAIADFDLGGDLKDVVSGLPLGDPRPDMLLISKEPGAVGETLPATPTVPIASGALG